MASNKTSSTFILLLPLLLVVLLPLCIDGRLYIATYSNNTLIEEEDISYSYYIGIGESASASQGTIVLAKGSGCAKDIENVDEFKGKTSSCLKGLNE